MKGRGSTASALLILVSLLALSAPAYAGTVVTGDGATLEEAMATATRNVEAAAKAAKRCVSEYPRLDTCVQLKNGTFRCRGVRANHKGSCN
jgi:uncharacterized protein (UPF0333 family)